MTGDRALDGQPNPSGRAPDAVEPIAAYRVWRVDEALRLRSPNSDTSWSPGEWLIAKCERNRHPAPRERCTCGVYSAKDINAILVLAGMVTQLAGMVTQEGGGDRSNPLAIIGRVELAGKVIEHDEGYRAERARIIQVLPVAGSRSRAEAVAARYGVPVGEEIPAEAIPEFLIPDLLGYAHICHFTGSAVPSALPSERTVPGRLFLLTTSMFIAINAVRGILWETHRLEWSDWWVWLIAVAGAIGVWRAIRPLPRVFRGWSLTEGQ